MNDLGVPDQARRLSSFLGSWSVDGTMAEGDRIAAVEGEWRFGCALDGWGVLGDLVTSIEGLGEFREAEILGFDTSTDEVHMVSANKFAIRDHVGGWVGLDQLKVRWEGTVEGDPAVEEITIRFDRPGHMTARVVETASGAVMATTDLTLTNDNRSVEPISDPSD